MPVKGLDEFSKNIRDYAKKVVPAEFAIFHRVISLNAARLLIQMTPKDTGRASGNWQTTINETTEGVVDDINLSDKEAAGKEALEKANQTLKTLQPFQTVLITNNISYIEFLEKGSSTLAPNGMIEGTIQTLNTIFP